jgi:N-acyl-D-aspartate/D-glutamate deacylase
LLNFGTTMFVTVKEAESMRTKPATPSTGRWVRMGWRWIACALAALFVSACGAGGSPAASADELATFDVVIKNVAVVDGSGAAPFDADVMIRGDTIVAVGSAPAAARAGRVIDGRGRLLAPGFIDMHAHGDPLHESFENFLAMGVTTVVLGQDGVGPGLSNGTKSLSFSEWAAVAGSAGVQINVAALVGHGTLRRRAGIPDAVRTPTSGQQARMVQALRADLQSGACGMSSGLEYVPGLYSKPEELAPLAHEVGAFGGVVMSHMRSEDDELIERSIDELIAPGGTARFHISHLKVMYAKGEERAQRLLGYIESKRAAGVKLTADAYPYTAGYTGVAILFPEWAQLPADYPAAVATRRGELADHLMRRMTRRGGPGALLFGSQPYAGKTLEQAAKQAGKSYVDFLIDIGPQGGAGAHFTIDETLQDALVCSPLTAVSTDGAPGMRHPRATGAFAKVLQLCVREQRRLSIEQAVHKSTGLPAHILGLANRGVIRRGAKADLVLFDLDRVRATSTYLDPLRLAEGFDIVIVNGRIAREDGMMQPGRAGRVLRARELPGEG